jgi:hypothetical protein
MQRTILAFKQSCIPVSFSWMIIEAVLLVIISLFQKNKASRHTNIYLLFLRLPLHSLLQLALLKKSQIQTHRDVGYNSCFVFF